MILRCFWLLAGLLPFSFADVKFTIPAAGSTITGSTIDIEWEESGVTPPITDLVSYQLFLCAGGNDPSPANFIPVATLVQMGTFTSGNKVAGRFSVTIGADTENAYFLQMISATTGGSIVNYSGRFTLSSMTGSFPGSVTAGLETVSGTDGPDTQNEVQSPQNGANTNTVVAGQTGVFATPYNLQTGLTRYAPMPPVPATRITVKNVTPQWPTSAYVIYPTIAGPPNAAITITAAQTDQVARVENTATAAGQPTDAALQKFLNRWKD